MVFQPTHAGAVVFRDTDHGLLFLVIAAKGAPHHWVLPKGHIETGEAPEQAAVREVAEEAGSVAEIIASLGSESFRVGDTVNDVAYFLARHTGERTPAETREKAWLPKDAAIERLTFNESKAVMGRAVNALGRIGGLGGNHRENNGALC